MVDFRSSGAINRIPCQEVNIMELRTHRNGGEASLKEVAAAWKTEDHHFHWSEYASDKHTVELAHKLDAAALKNGPAIPDPRNLH